MSNFTHSSLTRTVRCLALLFFGFTWAHGAEFRFSGLTVENDRLSLTYTPSRPGTYRLLQGATVHDIREPIATNTPQAGVGLFSVLLRDRSGAGFYRIELFGDNPDADNDGVPDALEPPLAGR